MRKIIDGKRYNTETATAVSIARRRASTGAISGSRKPRSTVPPRAAGSWPVKVVHEPLGESDWARCPPAAAVSSHWTPMRREASSSDTATPTISNGISVPRL